jgi:hypothetical protein
LTEPPEILHYYWPQHSSSLTCQCQMLISIIKFVLWLSLSCDKIPQSRNQ